MAHRLKLAAGVVLAIAGLAFAWAACASIVWAAAAFTKGVDDAPDRGLEQTSFESGWEVTSFNADYRIGADGVLAATERIDVDFHFLQKHGIFRNLFWRVNCRPPRIATETADATCPAGELRTYQINIKSVTDATGKAVPYSTPRVGDTQQVKIGDANQLISGKQSYVITYTVDGALDGYSGHDELYWNATGGWPVPITAFAISVHPPSGSIQEADCFQGTALKSALCKSATTSDGGATYRSSAVLSSQQQATIVATFPNGVAAVTPPSIWHEPSYRDFYSLDAIEIGGGVIVALLAAAALIALWWRDGRDRQYKTLYYLTNDPSEGRKPLFGGPPIVVEFTPPDDLRPAQMGLILDERADPLDVTATLIDLAVRGYLSIKELNDPDRDWRLTRLKEGDDDLLPYERSLLKAVFNVEKEDTVRISELKHHFQSQLEAVEERLYKDALQKKWFDEHPEKAKMRWVGVGVLVAIVGIVLCFGAGLRFERALMLNAIPVAGIALIPLSSAMSRRTATGSEALRRVLGFRLYIDTAETRRQEFNEQANIFAKYLPYAIVFGSVTKWAKAFSGLDKQVQDSLSWYSGGNLNTFATTAFSASLAGLASGMSSSISAAPIAVSSGGFSSGGGGGFSGFSGGGFGGGGFSGGGGGGGGGGSW